MQDYKIKWEFIFLDNQLETDCFGRAIHIPNMSTSCVDPWQVLDQNKLK